MDLNIQDLLCKFIENDSHLDYIERKILFKLLATL